MYISKNLIAFQITKLIEMHKGNSCDESEHDYLKKSREQIWQS